MNLLDLLQQMTDGAKESYTTLGDGLVGDRLRNPRDQEVFKENAMTFAGLPFMPGLASVPSNINKGMISTAKRFNYSPAQLKLTANQIEAAKPLNANGLNPMQQQLLNRFRLQGGVYGVGGALAAKPLYDFYSASEHPNVDYLMQQLMENPYVEPAASLALAATPMRGLGSLKTALDLSLLGRELTKKPQ